MRIFLKSAFQKEKKPKNGEFVSKCSAYIVRNLYVEKRGKQEPKSAKPIWSPATKNSLSRTKPQVLRTE